MATQVKGHAKKYHLNHLTKMKSVQMGKVEGVPADGGSQTKVSLLIYTCRKAVSIAECPRTGMVRGNCLNRPATNPRDARPVPGHGFHDHADIFNLIR